MAQIIDKQSYVLYYGIMKKTNKTSTLFRSYELNHKANPSKVDALFELYQIHFIFSY